MPLPDIPLGFASCAEAGGDVVIHTMRSFLLRLAIGAAVVMTAGTSLLLGGYHISSLLKPTWPQDYHATAAIVLMALVMIGYTGWVAMRSPANSRRSETLRHPQTDSTTLEAHE